MNQSFVRILHISDPHFGKLHWYKREGLHNMGGQSLAGAIRSALMSAKLPANSTDGQSKLDALVVSGDFLSIHEEDDLDLNNAIDCTKELIRELDLTEDQVLAVPGNHDAKWLTNEDQKFIAYNELCRRLKFDMCTDDMPVLKVWPADTPKVVFCGFNSCIPEHRDTAGLGLIGEEQIELARQRIDNLGDAIKDVPRIAVIHHQLIPVDEAEVELRASKKERKAIEKMPSVLKDANKLLEVLQDLNFTALLHGHRHVSAILRHADVGLNNSNLFVLSAGSCGHKSYHYRHFYVLDVFPTFIRVHSFKTPSGSGIFTRESQHHELPVPRTSLEAFRKKSEDENQFMGEKLGQGACVSFRNPAFHEQYLRKKFALATDPLDFHVVVVNGDWVGPIIANICREYRGRLGKVHIRMMKPATYSTLEANGWLEPGLLHTLRAKVSQIIDDVEEENVFFYFWDRLQEMHGLRVGDDFWFGRAKIDDQGRFCNGLAESFYGHLDDERLKKISESLWPVGTGLPLNDELRNWLNFENQ